MSADAKASAFPVALYTLLDEGLIQRVAEPGSKEELVRRLGVQLSQKAGLADGDSAIAKILEREAGISTTLDTGLSLPHARLDGLKGFAAVLALLPRGLPDPQQPELTIKAMLLFFSPNDSAFFQKHLQFLRHVATLFQPAFIDQLLACRNSKEVLEALKAKES